jgi:hypothetical protein
MKYFLKPAFFLTLLLVTCSFQIISTSFNVTVRDENGNVVKDAVVQLFEKRTDYEKETNVSATGTTDEKGFVKIKDLKAISYFVIVRKDDKSNSGGGEQTGKLTKNKINKATIVIQ